MSSGKDPIIQSLLDLDFYKLTMGQLVWALHSSVRVTYAFHCRTKNVRLDETVPEEALREELEHVQTLRFTEDEIDGLRTNRHYPEGLFTESYLRFLGELRLPPLSVKKKEGGYEILAAGPWPEAIFWETIVLSIMNELHARTLVARSGGPFHEAMSRAWREGGRKLGEKIGLLKSRPGVKFVEFGTRRRFSADWQEYVTSTLKRALPDQLIGTSNVALAGKLGIKPVGTYAHELPMVYAALAGDAEQAVRNAQIRVVHDLLAFYGNKLPIYALVDTFGSSAFYKDLPAQLARDLAGVRLDSGDNVFEAEKAIMAFERLGIDPKCKGCFWSDGLEPQPMLALEERFSGLITPAFGPGTNLTNDLGFPALSIVMKAVEANGRPTVKLSNNPAKATGPSEEIARYRRIFDCEEGDYQECRY